MIVLGVASEHAVPPARPTGRGRRLEFLTVHASIDEDQQFYGQHGRHEVPSAAIVCHVHVVAAVIIVIVMVNVADMVMIVNNSSAERRCIWRGDRGRLSRMRRALGVGALLLGRSTPPVRPAPRKCGPQRAGAMAALLIVFAPRLLCRFSFFSFLIFCFFGV